MPYVYVLSNPSFAPDRLKIGKSIDAEERRKNLHTTGVPTPFVIEAQYEVEDHHWLEKELHDTFRSMRVDKGREFFDGITPKMVHEAVVDLLIEGELGDDTITPYDLAESYKRKELQMQEYANQLEEERLELARVKVDAEVKYRLEQEYRERRDIEEAKRTKMIWCCGVALAIGLWVWNNDVKEQAKKAEQVQLAQQEQQKVEQEQQKVEQKQLKKLSDRARQVEILRQVGTEVDAETLRMMLSDDAKHVYKYMGTNNSIVKTLVSFTNISELNGIYGYSIPDTSTDYDSTDTVEVYVVIVPVDGKPKVIQTLTADGYESGEPISDYGSPVFISAAHTYNAIKHSKFGM